MATMEGPLSKWTNVMKGWQYRWFVLDSNTCLLSYYTSKEKMMRGSRRGCFRLKNAVIGIDDEDDSTFTITLEQKTFHFQARDAEEREKWVDALEDTVTRHALALQSTGPVQRSTSIELDRKLAETDAYLQILIDQVKNFDEKIEKCEDIAAKEKYNVIKITAEAMIESIKQAIVVMQMTRQSIVGSQIEAQSVNEVLREGVMTSASEVLLNADANHLGSSPRKNHTHHKSDTVAHSVSMPNLSPGRSVPNMDVYCSSEEDDFFDAEEYGADEEEAKDNSSRNDGTVQISPAEVITSKDDCFDELYDEKDNDELESLDQHGSIIAHLLSQVRIGMDLTKIVLPTFILERRSLLEMYADFFAHPDLFVGIADFESPRDRMVQLVRWYLSAFHAGRPSSIAKKPYNPILGETFECSWDLPGITIPGETVKDGPVLGGKSNNVSFIAEQVSHHPPISAFYAEHYNNRITLDGYIWTKSRFLGLSIGVHMIGQAVVSVLDYDEEYILTFPNGYGRSILTVPWVELGGKVNISCVKTGFSAVIDFLTKPFYGGKKHHISASILSPNDKKPFCTVQGEWNGVMWAQYSTGMSEKFVDTKTMPIVKKKVKPLAEQGEFESRMLWKEVTYHLKQKNVEKATEFKQKLEQRQREEAKVRKETGAKIETKFFHEVGEHWVYDRSLPKRLQAATLQDPGVSLAADD